MIASPRAGATSWRPSRSSWTCSRRPGTAAYPSDRSMRNAVADTPGARRRLGRALAEMHYQLRTEADTPARTAGAVFIGTLIGCLPVYGAQLVLCFGLARILGLSRVKAYLAAHVNNPLTAPFLLALEFGV